MSDEADTISLSLLMIQAAKAAGLEPDDARSFIDELVKLPGEAAHKILINRERAMLRRVNEQVRRAAEGRAPRGERS